VSPPPTAVPTANAIPAADLAAAVAAAQPGDTLVVSGGVFHGRLTLDRPLTLIGQGWPVLDGGGAGTVVTIAAAGSHIEGFVIRGSGSSLDQENAGIAATAPRQTIAGNRFEDTLFGIYLREAPGSVIRDNVIHGKALAVPRRGDGIRVWASHDTRIEHNEVTNGRDVVLWYSERLTVRGNDVRSGRYGLHFMYCDDALITQNRLLDNSVGAFLMYSRRLRMVGNTVAGNRGPSGYGVGLKDVDDAEVRQNLFLDNRAGVYLDGSPREVDSVGQFTGNVFAYNDIGVEMLPAVRHNQFSGNSFVDNEEQVAIAGGGTPGVNEWSAAGQGNYWSDYAGYDLDGDGRGELPYRSNRLFENLMQREPALRLFLYSPATNALDFAARAFPLVQPQPKLVDERPLTQPAIPTNAPPLPRPENQPWLETAVGLIGLALALALGLPRWQGRFTANRTRMNTDHTDQTDQNPRCPRESVSHS
ncbi:MAG: nitrous oxide reductase family maturation protein NosD, partial [Anaerolineales bacterium]|nr:nitrous oxide reductase family maturation protein NosD [Anaerolineales bacterium]